MIVASEAWHLAAITYLLNLDAPDTGRSRARPDRRRQGDLRVRDRKLHERHVGEAITARELFGWHAQATPQPGLSGKCHDVEDDQLALFAEPC